MDDMQRRIIRHIDRRFDELRDIMSGISRSLTQRIPPRGRRLGGDPGQGFSSTRPSPPGGADGGDVAGLD